MPTYSIRISIDLGSVIPEVKELSDNLNSTLSTFGVEEKLGIRGRLFSMNLTTNNNLTKKDKEQVKTILEATFKEQHPSWIAKVESFRRQSGNVQQSAIQ